MKNRLKTDILTDRENIMQKNNTGFTLIELLAVVLIIGILVAIALPQYRRSIERAEAMEALVNLRSLFDSAKRYKAANSQVPMQLNGLDISFFDASADDSSTFNIGKFQYAFSATTVSVCRINGNYCFHFYYNHPTRGKDVLTCKLSSTNGKYDWLCEAIGTTNLGNNEYLLDR